MVNNQTMASLPYRMFGELYLEEPMGILDRSHLDTLRNLEPHLRSLEIRGAQGEEQHQYQEQPNSIPVKLH